MKSGIVALATSTLLATSALSYAMELPEHVLLDAGYSLAEEQTYTFRSGDDWGSIDPGLVQDTTGGDIVRQMFEGLYNQDADGNNYPALAADMKVSEDGKTYTFALRQGVKWSDGNPVTAHDFEYAWKRVADPATASEYASYIQLMSLKNADEVLTGKAAPDELGVTALDDHTLQVELTVPLPYFPLMLTHATTFPVPRWAIEAHGDEWVRPENIVVNGAYKLSEFRPGERAVLERNSNYWDDKNTVINKVVQLTITDENQAYNRYRAGEMDYTNVPTGKYPGISQEFPEETHSAPVLCSYYLNMNQGPSGPDYLKDPRVRRALSLVIDRQLLVDKVTQAGQIPAYTFTPEATAGFTVPYLPYYTDSTQAEKDEEARELLESAGYGPDNPLTVDYIYNTSEGHKKIAIFVSQMWKQKLGVETVINNMEWKTLLDTRNSGNFEIARDGWCADYNEPSTFLDVFKSDSSHNSGKYSNTAVDKLLDESKTTHDPQTMYTIIEGFLAEDTAFIPVYHYTDPILVNPKLKGYPFNNASQNWYVKDMYKVDEN